MIALGLWLLIAIPVSAFVQSVAASELWRWFLSARYGAGPSRGEWFGISCLVVIATTGLARSTTKADDISDVMSTSVYGWVTTVMFLVLSYGVGSIFGWIG